MKEVKGRGNQEDLRPMVWVSRSLWDGGAERPRNWEKGGCSFIRCIHLQMANSFGHVRQEQRGGASLESQQGQATSRRRMCSRCPKGQRGEEEKEKMRHTESRLTRPREGGKVQLVELPVRAGTTREAGGGGSVSAWTEVPP